MARRAGKGHTGGEGQKNARKGGNLFAGLLIGLALGLAMAAGLAWYLNMSPGGIKRVDAIVDPAPLAEQKHTPAKAEPKAPPTPPERQAKTAPTPARAEAKPQPAPKTESPPAPQPKVNYTFYGILPGDKPARPVEPPTSKDTWWLQIAALSDPRKADQIRARLVLLNLRASTQKIDSNGQPLYRIRVGPYQREDDAFGDLDILTENDFNARLLKDPVNPK